MLCSSVMDLHHIPLYNRKKRRPGCTAWTCAWLDAKGQNCYWGCKRYRISARKGSALNHPSGHQIKQCTAVWGFQGKNCGLQSFEPSTRYGSSPPFNSCIGNFWISCTRVIFYTLVNNNALLPSTSILSLMLLNCSFFISVMVVVIHISWANYNMVAFVWVWLIPIASLMILFSDWICSYCLLLYFPMLIWLIAIDEKSASSVT